MSHPFSIEHLLQLRAIMEVGYRKCAEDLGLLQPYISLNQAYKLYGRKTVERWSEERLITIIKDGTGNIVSGGYSAATEALAGVQGAAIRSVSVGDSGVLPSETDTSITNVSTVEIQSVEFPDETTVRFNFTIGYDDANNMHIREFGLITADGRLFSRKTREPIEKTQYMSIVGQWGIHI